MNAAFIRMFATCGLRDRLDDIPRALIQNIMNNKHIEKFGNDTTTRTWICASENFQHFHIPCTIPVGVLNPTPLHFYYSELRIEISQMTVMSMHLIT